MWHKTPNFRPYRFSKFLVILICCFGATTQSLAQDELGILVLSKVNHLRDSLHLKRLKYDDLLVKAAEDHAYYMADKNKLTHFQQTFTKETPAERIAYYKGSRTYSGENVATAVPLKKNEQLDANGIAENLYQSWFHSPKHYQNIIHPEFTKMGLGVSLSKSKKLYAAQVFSSDEIRLPKEFKHSDLAWGVRPAEFNCKDEAQTYQTLFFANSILVEDKSIYFFFHDRAFFEKVIHADNDGLAIDVVLREQLPCGKENQFHISEVYDGEMQRPIYRSDILRKNVANNPKKIKVKVGEVPAYLGDKQWAANMIIINDNKLCDYSVPAYAPSAIFPLLKIKPYFDINDGEYSDSSVSTTVTIKDSMHVEVMYQRRKKHFYAVDQKAYYRMMGWGAFIDSVDVQCFASVEGAVWFNEQLLEDRSDAVLELLQQGGFDLSRVHLKADVNWDMMQQQIASHSLKPLENKSKAEIRSYLKRNKSEF